MVNPKRIEQKLPLLAANGPTLGFDYEEKDWWIKKLKRYEPEKYMAHLNNIVNEVTAIEQSAMDLKRKKFNGNGNGHR